MFHLTLFPNYSKFYVLIILHRLIFTRYSKWSLCKFLMQIPCSYSFNIFKYYLDLLKILFISLKMYLNNIDAFNKSEYNNSWKYRGSKKINNKMSTFIVWTFTFTLRCMIDIFITFCKGKQIIAKTLNLLYYNLESNSNEYIQIHINCFAFKLNWFSRSESHIVQDTFPSPFSPSM